MRGRGYGNDSEHVRLEKTRTIGAPPAYEKRGWNKKPEYCFRYLQGKLGQHSNIVRRKLLGWENRNKSRTQKTRKGGGWGSTGRRIGPLRTRQRGGRKRPKEIESLRAQKPQEK